MMPFTPAPAANLRKDTAMNLHFAPNACSLAVRIVACEKQKVAEAIAAERPQREAA